jgi:hypothetical protein
LHFKFAPIAVSFLSMTQGSSRKLGAALIVIGAALLFAGARSRPAPAGPYAFASVIHVTKPDSEEVSLSEALREECNLLESTALLEAVVSNLSLTAKWSTTNEQVSVSEARRRLSSNLLVLPEEGSSQIRVRVSGPDKQQTEEIANSILRVYPEVRRGRFRQTKPKVIVDLEEQLSEVEPKLRLAIDTMERVGKDLTVADVYQTSRSERTLLDRITEGKEDDQPENTSYYYDPPPPKDETPTQAKRRIYLKNRRVAEVLTTRKARIQTRLEIERGKTSTPESATVQVVQQPQPVEAVTASTPRRSNKSWYFAGGACLLLGVVSFTRKDPSVTVRTRS